MAHRASVVGKRSLVTGVLEDTRTCQTAEHPLADNIRSGFAPCSQTRQPECNTRKKAAARAILRTWRFDKHRGRGNLSVSSVQGSDTHAGPVGQSGVIAIAAAFPRSIQKLNFACCAL